MRKWQKPLRQPEKAANWFMGEVLRLTKDKGLDVEKVSFTPEHLSDLIQMVEKKSVHRMQKSIRKSL